MTTLNRISSRCVPTAIKRFIRGDKSRRPSKSSEAFYSFASASNISIQSLSVRSSRVGIAKCKRNSF